MTEKTFKKKIGIKRMMILYQSHLNYLDQVDGTRSEYIRWKLDTDDGYKKFMEERKKKNENTD